MEKNNNKKNKVKSRINKIPATVKNNYGDGLLAVSIDIADYELDKNEILIINYKLCNFISNEQWDSIINEENKKIIPN